MDFEFKIGMKETAQDVVAEQNTAVFMGSGSLPVYATPAMLALIEKASALLAQKTLPDLMSTVGILLNVKHIAATPVGMKVRVESELILVEGRKLTFKVTAFDEKEKIAEGIHERFVIKKESFLQKAEAKLY
ncbi:thioesterase family protein [Propionispira raffinosivorans]|uniref:thioesterase family protein n=1 Tax=Propionispira raffinosivorans TaxID=86959 RepID=UPI000382C57F|nr:thioesterase family protein [Propionispira raffinosivorans]